MASDTKPAEEKPAEQKPEQKPTALGEDDEFEDFPVDGTNPNCTLHIPPSGFPHPRSLPTQQQSYLASWLSRQQTITNTSRSDWPEDQTEAAQGSGETKHLWEESWDDDDTTDDFSAQLKWVALDPPSSPRFDWTDSIRQIQSRNVLWQYFDDTG